MASLNAPAWNLALPCSFSASAFLAPVVAASASMDAVRGSLAPFSAPSSSITAARVPCERESVRCEETSERSPRHAHFVEACVGHRTWTRPSRRQASGEASFRSCTVFRSIPALHVGHRVPMRGSCRSWPPPRALRVRPRARHPVGEARLAKDVPAPRVRALRVLHQLHADLALELLHERIAREHIREESPWRSDECPALSREEECRRRQRRKEGAE